jgi:hypothetical protein
MVANTTKELALGPALLSSRSQFDRGFAPLNPFWEPVTYA